MHRNMELKSLQQQNMKPKRDSNAFVNRITLNVNNSQ